MRIRVATSRDQDAVREVHQCAFGEDEREIVSELAVWLLSEETTPTTISLVAECDGAVVGHAAFSPVTMATNENAQGYILAPLAVKPDFQGQGVGSQLVESGRQKLEHLGVHILFVYGDPAFYSRFGFQADAADRYIPPYKLQYPFGWQACIVNECNISETPCEITCVTSLSDPKLW